MSLLEKILGPKSKYDKTIPYTYEARICAVEGSNEYNSYFSDTICGLVEYLHQNGIKPDEVQIAEVFQEKELQLDRKRYASSDNQWLFKPDLCRSFAGHYKGHIHEHSCTFNDRDSAGDGP
jgi:hypothetical protein